MKVSVVGMGQVGSTLAYTLLLKGICSQLTLVSRRPGRALGEAYDLKDSRLFVDHPPSIKAGGVEETKDSDVIAMCASVPWQEDFEDRLSSASANTRLLEELVPPLAEASPNAVFLIISNPVDVLTYHTLRLSGFPPSRCIGTGTLIDSARFRGRLSDQLNIHPMDLHAHILGEHGDSQFPALSVSEAGGERVEDGPERRRIFQESMKGGHAVFEHKKYTNFAIASAAAAIINAIGQNTHRLMTVSSLVNGYLGVTDVCMSLPCAIGRGGVHRQLHPSLNPEEIEHFRHSAQVLKAVIANTTPAPGGDLAPGSGALESDATPGSGAASASALEK